MSYREPTRAEILIELNRLIDFAIETDDPVSFLRCWREGDWPTLQEEWKYAPPAYVPTAIVGHVHPSRPLYDGPLATLQRPKTKCPYCKQKYANVLRHVRRQHKGMA